MDREIKRNLKFMLPVFLPIVLPWILISLYFTLWAGLGTYGVLKHSIMGDKPFAHESPLMFFGCVIWLWLIFSRFINYCKKRVRGEIYNLTLWYAASALMWSGVFGFGWMENPFHEMGIKLGGVVVFYCITKNLLKKLADIQDRDGFHQNEKGAQNDGEKEKTSTHTYFC